MMKNLIPVITETTDYLMPDNLPTEVQKFVRLRNIVLEHIKLNPSIDLPKYLLAFEVHQLINYAYDLSHSMLIKTLWLTGGRINEIVKSLKVSDLGMVEDQLIMSLITLKQHNKKVRKNGYVENAEPEKRAIVITDGAYIQSLKVYIKTKSLKNNDYLFNITDRTARNWINKAVNEASKHGVTFPIEVNPKTLRHSNAMHLVFNGYSEKEIQAMLGHKNSKNTQIYTNLKALDVKKRARFL